MPAVLDAPPSVAQDADLGLEIAKPAQSAPDDDLGMELASPTPKSQQTPTPPPVTPQSIAQAEAGTEVPVAPGQPTSSIQAHQPTFGESVRAAVGNTALGHSLESTLPKVADALGIRPTQTPSSPSYEQSKDNLLSPEYLVEHPGGAANPASATENRIRGVARGVGALTSGSNLALMGKTAIAAGLTAGIVNPASAQLLSKLVSGGFTLDMLKGLYQQHKQYRQAVDSGHIAEAQQIQGEMGVTGVMAFLTGKHASEGIGRAGEESFSKARAGDDLHLGRKGGEVASAPVAADADLGLEVVPDRTRTFTAPVNAARQKEGVKFDTGGFDFDKFDAANKGAVQGSTDGAAIRAAAEKAHPTLRATIEGALANVSGAELDGSRVKSAESMQTKGERGTAAEDMKDVLGFRVAVETQQAGMAAIRAISQAHEVVGREPLDSNGLKGWQLFVRAGKPGDPLQVAEIQILPKPQVDVLDKTTPIYEQQKEAEAKGNTVAAEAASDKATDLHEAALTGEQPTKYEFGSTQANLPASSDAAKAIGDMQSRIPDEDLAGDGKDLDKFHVTVRYGLKNGITPELRKFIESQVRFEASLGPTTSFPPSKNSDGAAPIIAPVESAELHKLNAAIEKAGEFEPSSFPDYQPHVTVAFVKPELAEKYSGMKDAAGKTFPIDSIAISDQNGKHTEIPLLGGKSTQGEERAGKAAPEGGKEPAAGEGAKPSPATESQTSPPVPEVRPESAAVPKSEAEQPKEVARPKSDGARAQEEARPEDSHQLIHVDQAPPEVVAWNKDEVAKFTGSAPALTITSQKEESLDPKTLKTTQTWAGANKLKEFEKMPTATTPSIAVVRTSDGDYVVDGVHRASRAAKAGEQVKATVYTVKLPKLAKGSQVELPDGRTGTLRWTLGKDARVELADKTRWDGKLKDLKAAAEGVTSGTPGHEKPAHGAIAVDFDKTLATYEEWKGPAVLGKPIPEQVEQVKQMLADGKDVWIFSARAAHPEAIPAIKAWSKEHIGQELPVTNIKYPSFSLFIDDRALNPLYPSGNDKAILQKAGALGNDETDVRQRGTSGTVAGEKAASGNGRKTASVSDVEGDDRQAAKDATRKDVGQASNPAVGSEPSVLDGEHTGRAAARTPSGNGEKTGAEATANGTRPPQEPRLTGQRPGQSGSDEQVRALASTHERPESPNAIGDTARRGTPPSREVGAVARPVRGVRDDAGEVRGAGAVPELLRSGGAEAQENRIGGKRALPIEIPARVLSYTRQGDRAEGGRGVRSGEQGAKEPAQARTEAQPGVGAGQVEGKAKTDLARKQAKFKARKAKKETARNTKELADFFTPGNIVTAYGGFDKVLAFTPPSSEGTWSVRVIHTDKDGNVLPNERPRTHSTYPDKGYKVVKRVEPPVPGKAETPAKPITEEKAVAPGTETPTAHEGKVAQIERLKAHLETAKKRVDEASGSKSKGMAMYRLRDEVYKTQTAIKNLEREIEGDRTDAQRIAKREQIPLTRPEEKLVTDPDKDKWGYQREYFMGALEPAKDAWISSYPGFGENPEEVWKFLVKNESRGRGLPTKFPDDFIRIEVPNDGKFLVKNEPAAIDRILKSAPSAFAKPKGASLAPGKETKPRAPKEFDQTKYIEQMERELADARKEKADLQRQGTTLDYQYYDDRIKAAEQNLREARNPDPEAGFLDIGPLAEMAVPLREELERRSEVAGVANNVHDVLTRLDRSNKATTLEAKGIARAFEDAGFTKEHGDKVFAHIEDPSIKLTPRQIELRDKWIKPLDARAAQQRQVALLIKSGKFSVEDILAGNVPPEEVQRYASEQPNYQHRIPVDKNSFVKRILGDSMKRFRAGGSALSRTFSSGKRSVFYEIHGPDGKREAVAVKNGRVTRFRMGADGKPIPVDMGAFRSGLTDAGKETDERMAPFVQRITELRDEIADMPEADKQEQLASVQARIKDIEKQMDLLNKVKAPVGRTSAFGGKVVYSTEPTFGQRADLSRKLDVLRKREERIKNGTEPMLAKNVRKMDARKEELKGNEDFRDAALDEGEQLQGRTWKDKNGDQWKFDRGTTKFISERTGQKYHANAMLSSLVNYMETSKAMNAAVVMERLKGIMADQGMAVKSDNPLTVPDGWKSTSLIQMHNYYFPVHIADTLDQFDSLQSRGDPNILERANRFIIQTVLMNPLMHGKNIAANFFTGKAAEAITGNSFVPRWYADNAKAGVQAVNTLKDIGGPEYRRLLRLGLDLQSADSGFDQTTKEILRSFADQLAKNKESNVAMSALLKVGDAAVWMQSKNHLATFGINDLFLLQSFYARRAQLMHEGIPEDLAEQAARDWAHLQVAEYTTPARVVGSAVVGRAMENPELSSFWRYHFGGILRPVLNAVTDAVGPFRPDESMTEVGGGALGRVTETSSGRTEETNRARNARGQTESEARINAIARLAVLTLFATVVYPKVLDRIAKKFTGDAQAKAPRGGVLGFASDIADTAAGDRTPTSLAASVFTPAIGTEEFVQLALNRDSFTGKHIMGTNVGAEDKVKQLAAWLGSKSTPGQMTHRFDQGRGKQALYSLLGFTFPMEHGLLEASKIRGEAAGSNPADPRQAKIWQSIMAASEQARRSDGKDTRLKDALLRSGVLTPSQRREVIQASREAPIVFAAADLEHDSDVWQVFEHSTDAEKHDLVNDPKTWRRIEGYARQLRIDHNAEQAAEVQRQVTASR